MSKDQKVQFVCFETILDKDAFIKRWEQYTRSVKSNKLVTLQQSEKSGAFKYISQHRFEAGELLFVFSKEHRTSRVVQASIKTTQIGGYSVLQEERSHEATRGEHKLFIFLTDPKVDLTIYKGVSVPCKLNIYEAYYENCRYAYILEYFVKAKDATILQTELSLHNSDEVEIYKEFAAPKALQGNKERDFYVWPSA
ncbi:MAG: hypothetical protein ABI594_13440 [Ginsengibacter sp.]